MKLLRIILRELRLPIFVLMTMTSIELYGGYLLFSHGFRHRFIKVPSLQSLQINPIKSADIYKSKTANLSWVHSETSKLKYIMALKWTMNHVKKIANNPAKAPEALLKSVELGEGTSCDGMSTLYLNTLAAANLPARRIWLYRNLFAFDNHSSVEVLLDGKWIVIDPTFGISFTDKTGQLLSSQEIKAYLFKGNYEEIKPIFYGEVAYPARLETSEINFLPLYNNVFVKDDHTANPIAQLPPFRYWFGPKMYYEKLSNESDSNIIFVQNMYFIFIVLLPISIVLVMAFIGYKITILIRNF